MKRNENGRSMIEMLGVLAIIGVLSVGGIYGYTVAMRKYKANEIAQTMSMLATIAHSANAGQGATTNLQQSGLEQNPAGVALHPTDTVATCSQNDSCATVTVTVVYAANAVSQSEEPKLSQAVANLLPTNATLSGFKRGAIGSVAAPTSNNNNNNNNNNG